MSSDSSPTNLATASDSGPCLAAVDKSCSDGSRIKGPLSEDRAVHFVGIGGIGMSGMAKVLLQLGHQVSGSDLSPSPITETLQHLGATIHYGHAETNVNGAELLVRSTAVPNDNAELATARKRGIPVIHRSEMLAAIMRRQRGIAVAGTHGKSTTTSMISLVLERSGLDPTILVGGELDDIGGNAKLGRGEFCVVEADESDGSLLNLEVERAVVTNVEVDHPDFFHSEDCVIETFQKFVAGIPESGLLVTCAACPNVPRVLSGGLASPVVTYGWEESSDYRAEVLEEDATGITFILSRRGEPAGAIRLNVPGRHNVLNALATIAMTESVGVDIAAIAEILPQYKGIHRRWETIANVHDVWIVDDYAHHPSEVRATLQAAKCCGRARVIAVFQPHRYTRTQTLGQEFGAAFADADYVIIGDVYAAHENVIPGVSGETVANAVRNQDHGKTVEYIPDKAQIATRLAQLASPGDLILTMGAGDVCQVGHTLASQLTLNS